MLIEYGSEAPMFGVTLEVNTKYRTIVGFTTHGLWPLNRINLTASEVLSLVDQLQAWLADNLRGDNPNGS